MNTIKTLRADHSLISSIVGANASVLDIGCGDGALLAHLRDTKNVLGYGLEIDTKDVSRAVTAGLSVVQGDADTDLKEYPDAAFDYVILSNSLQALHHPDQAVVEALRVGKRAIVSFPNFGYWRVRLDVLLRGQMPISHALPDTWFETTNIHLCTVRDFINLVETLGVNIEACYGFAKNDTPKAFSQSRASLSNLTAKAALFVLSGA